MSWKATFCAAGRGFAGKLVQRSGEIVAGEVEERREGRRQRASIVEEVVDGMADVELVDGEGGERRSRRDRQRRHRFGWRWCWRWRRWRWRRWFGNELGPEVEECGIGGIAQAVWRARRARSAGGARRYRVQPPDCRARADVECSSRAGVRRDPGRREPLSDEPDHCRCWREADAEIAERCSCRSASAAGRETS